MNQPESIYSEQSRGNLRSRQSVPFLRSPLSSLDNWNEQPSLPSSLNVKGKTLVARQAAELLAKDRRISELTAQLSEEESRSEKTRIVNHKLTASVEELTTKLAKVEGELAAQNRTVDFLRDQLSTAQGKLFDIQFKEPEAASRHPAFARARQNKSEVQWLLQLRKQGWYELEDLATTFAGENRLGEGFTPKDYAAIIQSVNTETVTVQYSKASPIRTFYFENPKSFVPTLPLYYQGRPVGVLIEDSITVDELMLAEGIV
ncbi:hypothetical protein ACMFMG_011192 [Clarireedia jacksonii]